MSKAFNGKKKRFFYLLAHLQMNWFNYSDVPQLTSKLIAYLTIIIHYNNNSSSNNNNNNNVTIHSFIITITFNIVSAPWFHGVHPRSSRVTPVVHRDTSRHSKCRYGVCKTYWRISRRNCSRTSDWSYQCDDVLQE